MRQICKSIIKNQGDLSESAADRPLNGTPWPWVICWLAGDAGEKARDVIVCENNGWASNGCKKQSPARQARTLYLDKINPKSKTSNDLAPVMGRCLLLLWTTAVVATLAIAAGLPLAAAACPDGGTGTQCGGRGTCVDSNTTCACFPGAGGTACVYNATSLLNVIANAPATAGAEGSAVLGPGVAATYFIWNVTAADELIGDRRNRHAIGLGASSLGPGCGNATLYASFFCDLEAFSNDWPTNSSSDLTGKGEVCWATT